MTPECRVLAEILAPIAREELLPRFDAPEARLKADGSLVTAADEAMQARTIEALQDQFPGIPVLGEEMSAAAQAQHFEARGGGLWVLDPLDGTSNFAAGIPYFAVSLAHIDAQGSVRSVVYDPVRDELFAAERGKGAWLNDRRLEAGMAVPAPRQRIALVDFKRLPEALACRLVTEPPYSSQRSFGAGALDLAWLAAGRVHLYLHGRQKLWDYAGGSLLLSESGAAACTLEGEAVTPDTLTPRSVVAGANPALWRKWASWIGVPGVLA